MCDIPEGWPLGAARRPSATTCRSGRAAPRARRSVNETRNAGDGLAGTGASSPGTPRAASSRSSAATPPKIWAICIGTRYIERAHERCRERGIPATDITVADWNERDNIRNFFCVVGGLMFEVIRVEPKPT